MLKTYATISNILQCQTSGRSVDFSSVVCFSLVLGKCFSVHGSNYFVEYFTRSHFFENFDIHIYIILIYVYI